MSVNQSEIMMKRNSKVLNGVIVINVTVVINALLFIFDED